MRINNPGKHFPELAGMPQEIQEEISEQARYQTYMNKGGRKRFVLPYVFFCLLGTIAVAVLAMILSHLLGIKTPVFMAIVIATGTIFNVLFVMHLQQKNWIRHMGPKIRELAKRHSLQDQ